MVTRPGEAQSSNFKRISVFVKILKKKITNLTNNSVEPIAKLIVKRERHGFYSNYCEDAQESCLRKDTRFPRTSQRWT